MIKKILILSVFLSSVLLISCEQSGKDSKKESNTQKQSTTTALQEWNKYIEFNTQGIISSQSQISIGFFSPIIDASKVGSSANDVLTFSPAIPGDAKFVSTREIVLIPSTPLPAGQKYQANLNTENFIGFPAALNKYQFNFSIIKQAFEIHLDGLTANSENNTVAVIGRLTTADFVNNAQISRMLTANLPGVTTEISWVSESNGKRHQFMIANLPRAKTAKNLTLSWDGNEIGVADRGNRTVEIPAIGEFKVASVRTIQAERQEIEINFTEELDVSQNLRGLIQIDQGNFSIRREKSVLKITPYRNLKGDIRLTIDQGIKNKMGFKLGKTFNKTLTFFSEKPQVRFIGKGSILPKNETLTVPFEAVNVDSVQVTAFQIYANNIGQFLQENNFDQNYGTHKVGRHLWRKTISLESPVQDTWNKYSLDVSDLYRDHPGALFRLTLSINRNNSTFSCSEAEDQVPATEESKLQDYDEENYQDSSSWDYAESYYNSEQHEWRFRNNPCKDAYYYYGENINSSRNYIASNIGIIAKRGTDKKITLATTDIATGLPKSGVKIDLYNFQNQKISQTVTNPDGLTDLNLDAIPFYAHAYTDIESGYLKLSSGRALQTSHFNVGGVTNKQGVKGKIYGERGVWRPGDDIFLTFVLEDKNKQLPANHPVTLEFYNPRGQLISSQTNNQPVNSFYAFKLNTAESAPTGNWRAVARLGGLVFHQKIKVEAVIPNRLKVELTTAEKELAASQMPVKTQLFSQWLHGAKAANLKAEVDVRLTSRKTQFDSFQDFNFDDPAREFYGESQRVFKGTLDKTGNVTFNSNFKPYSPSAGMLRANFSSRVYEESGAFSSASQSYTYHPYQTYLGMKLPKGDNKRNMLLTDVKHKIEIASLTSAGEKTSVKEVEISLYKINWKWWWDKSGESLARYASSYAREKVDSGSIFTKDGLGEWKFEIKYPAWGRYLVRACDKNGGHCTGSVFYIDWPGWAGRANDQKGIGASAINLSTDKEKYTVGETAIINLPPAKTGKALVSLETGSKILERYWIDLDGENTQLKLPLTPEMSPNIYFSLTILQAHKGKDNDLPIRLYGVTPIVVDDPNTQLSPTLVVAEEIAPQSTAEIKVAEQQGRAMTYTMAIVDEGLLGLTGYKTPNLRSHFYQKEALGVKTWDMFDDVVGAYGGELEKILALGGDASEKDKDKDGKKKRFPPVVKYLGPFHLPAGQSTTHQVEIPQYLGAVRVMLVAGHEGAYGSVEQSVYVRQALNVLATVPRVVGPDEELAIPVAAFVNEQALGDVSISVEHDEFFESTSTQPITLQFSEPGDQLGFVPIRVKSRLGKGKLTFIARHKNFESKQEVYIDIRSANPVTLRQTKTVIEAAQNWQTEITPHGMLDTNQLTVEMSRVPPLNLESRLNYLIRYPHGCVEQITSSVFPQLYLASLTQLEQGQTDELENNIAAAIEKLRGYQMTSGGFSYWPGTGKVHDWGNNYVGHFLVEARYKGYRVPQKMYADWIKFQTASANSWTTGNQMTQSYRLYTLALASQPALGAMNRLRERSDLDNLSRWYLAAAYQKIGQLDAARQLVASASFDVSNYQRAGDTLGSSLRDKAIILDSIAGIDEGQRTTQLVEEISDQLSSSQWLSTQSTAYALSAMSRYIFGNQPNNSRDKGQLVELAVNDTPAESITINQPIWKKLVEVKDLQSMSVKIDNQSEGKIYVTLHSEGIPKAGDEIAENSGLAIDVEYRSLSGSPIDTDTINQGEQIIIRAKVRNDTNRDFQNLALTQIFPSGWEIYNERMEAADSRTSNSRTANSQANYDYQDIRDDRVSTYFALKAGQTKTFETSVNAAYLGKFYLPAFKVEAMYDASKFAKSAGQWIQVIKTQ